MNLSRHIFFLPLCVFFLTLTAVAQPGFKVDIEKPAPYQERKLKSEKTGDGKLKGPKMIMQNLTTRFNYYFNANVKLNEVLDRARELHKDDYSQLLSFYNYDLNTTTADSAQLDSVIYKARTGLANHDLRNEWTDELYLLWGASWHLQQKFDSASMMLQFINYAYAPKFEDGYYKHIGTNADGARELSIATKEEKKLLHNNNFSRNTAFLWQIRTLIEMNNLTSAGSLISTLKRDPAFPKRLNNGLDEVEGYYFYRQKQWDSAAVHLLAALDGDYPKPEKARWYYLVAQLFERSGNREEAAKHYEKVVSMAPDPVMEVYARLNVVRLSKTGGEDATDKNLAELLKMARRDKYEEYRDIIYYMAGQMELERGNIAAASELLIKGSKASTGDQASKNKAFLQIADVSYDQKKYIQAAQFYDSVMVADLPDADVARVIGRKAGLQKVVSYSGVVYRQDSLQRIAALPQNEREAYVKALVKKLRKQQGLKEDATVTGGSTLTGMGAGGAPAPADLFAGQQKGEWYFYNPASKAQGAAQFKAVWGTRPNVDNWRRFSAVNQQLQSQPDRQLGAPDASVVVNNNGASAGTDLSIEGLTGILPLTPEAIDKSNDSIRSALFNLGTVYLNDLEDYPTAIATFEELRRRFPEGGQGDEMLFNLAFAYQKTGNNAAAAQVRKQLTEKYPSSRFAAITTTGKDPLATTKDSPEATRDYEAVYNMFIEGQFARALQAKRIADSTYRTNFWQPQLLYIEAVYHIKQRDDSVAKNVLQTIINQNSNKGLSDKAQNLINVLARRREIEDELTRLQITRPPEDEITPVQAVAKAPEVKPPVKDTAVVSKPVVDPKKDSAALALIKQKQVSDSIALSKVLAKQLRDSLETLRRDSLALAKKQAAEALRDSLAKKALADKQRTDSIAEAKAVREQARKDSIALRQALAKQATDSLALQKYYEKRQQDSLAKAARDAVLLAKKQADEARRDSLAKKALAEQQRKDSLALVKAALDQARKDSIATRQALLKQQRDSADLAKIIRDQARRDSLAQVQAALQRQRDSIALAKANAKPSVDPNNYNFDPNEAHLAVIVMDKVDPIFVNEARNAFFRYNKENYADRPLDVQIVNVTADTRLLVISGLTTAADATEYATKAKTIAAAEIIPWLTGNKYSFTIISVPNLELLKVKADINAYKKFLEQHLPGKF